MRKTVSFLIPIVLLLSSVSPLFATSDTSVSDVLGSTETTTTTPVTTTTTDNSLALTIPSQTDNPSTSITFIDPSGSKQGVQLETDSKGFVDVTSPYAFPALSIGKHTLEFKYVDENGATQVYDTSIIIIPRVPIFNAPVVDANTITISGTGLADSEIILLLSSGSTVISKTSTVDGDGNWEFSFERTLVEDGVYSVNAYIRRYGYASNLSETTKFTVGNSGDIQKSNGSNFNIQNLKWSDIWQFIQTKQDTIYFSLLFLIVGILLGLFVISKQKKHTDEKVVKVVEEKFTKIKAGEKEPTLREKLMGAVKEKDEQPKEEIKKEKEEEIITKIDFLKDFKNFDPDDSKGEEVVKSKVEVSLTSKKENS